MNVIDSNNSERDAGEKPVPTFSHPALANEEKASCGSPDKSCFRAGCGEVESTLASIALF
jgi:hypothetical protein